NTVASAGQQQFRDGPAMTAVVDEDTECANRAVDLTRWLTRNGDIRFRGWRAARRGARTAGPPARAVPGLFPPPGLRPHTRAAGPASARPAQVAAELAGHPGGIAVVAMEQDQQPLARRDAKPHIVVLQHTADGIRVYETDDPANLGAHTMLEDYRLPANLGE